LIKGGHDVLEYMGLIMEDASIEYGAIITVSSANPLKDMEDRLAADNYHRHFSLDGADFIAPFGMELKDIHVFLKG